MYNSTTPLLLKTSRFRQATVVAEYPIYPLFGIISTVIGTVAALVLMPVDPFPPGALYSSAIAMAIGLALAPGVAALRYPKTILRAEHLLVLAPIYWLLLDLLQGVYGMVLVDQESIQGAFIAIGLFVTMIWVAALARPWPLPKAIQRAASQPLNPKTIFSVIFVLFILGIFKYAFPSGFNPAKMLYYLGQDRWSAPWARGRLGSWDAFLDHMSYFGYLLPALTVLLACRSRWLSWRVIVSINLSLIIAVFLSQEGSRRVLGVIVGAAIIVWVLEQKKFDIRHIFIVLISAILLLGIMQQILIYRNAGFKALLTGEVQDHLYEDHLHVDDNFLRLSQVIYLVPLMHPYVYEQQIVYALVRPIPRVFWPGKPESSGFDLTASIGESGYSLSSSVIGEWYLSFGWATVMIGGWLYGRLASTVSRLLGNDTDSAQVVVYGIATMALFAGMRSMLDLISMSYALLAWIVVSRFFLHR
jgi:oligosaccharide repeat unit polymerase